MKRVVLEYGGAGLSVLGTIMCFDLLGRFFLGKDGVLATFITMVLGGL